MTQGRPPQSNLLQYNVITIRDWSLITGKGGYKMGKSQVRNLLHPPSRQGKTFCDPLFKSGNVLRPPFNMAKTSSYHTKLHKLPQNVVCPPFSMAKHFSTTPPFIGVKLHIPPFRFCSPPLPVISDQSLRLGADIHDFTGQGSQCLLPPAALSAHTILA